MMKTTITAIAGTALLFTASIASLTIAAHAQRSSIVLYDGSLGTGNIPPEQQGWLVFGGKARSQTSSYGVTHLITNRSAPAGYSNYQFTQQSLVNSSFPQLDRTKGYTIQFDVKLNDENHEGSDKNGDGIGDRAGFSVLVISNDQKGVELGFWKQDANPHSSDRIWIQQDGSAQPPNGSLFTHAEGAAFNTGEMTRYTLQVKGTQYKLFANDSAQPILTGALRNYTAFDHTANTPPLSYSPYATPNFLFLGDDTTSASANIDLSYIAVDLSPIAPF